MRRSNIAVFNEYLQQGTTSTTAVYTSTEMLSRLGQYDKIAIQAIVDNVTGAGTFSLVAEHSADGRNFTEITGTGMQNIAGSTINVNTTNNFFAYNTGDIPFLGYVRLKMYFSNTSTAAHVRVLVTQRDEGG